jgi:hypothetical protein
MSKLTSKDIKSALAKGDIIVTTKDIIREAVKEALWNLYTEKSDWKNNR